MRLPLGWTSGNWEPSSLGAVVGGVEVAMVMVLMCLGSSLKVGDGLTKVVGGCWDDEAQGAWRGELSLRGLPWGGLDKDDIKTMQAITALGGDLELLFGALIAR